MLMGLLAITKIAEGDYVMGAVLVFTGIFFDFFDGFFARLLNVPSAIGVQLDSLADMVTSGVAPGYLIYQLLLKELNHYELPQYFAYFGFILTLAAGYRLAKFNVDTRQNDGFIGLPTPAMSIFVMSIPLVQKFADFNGVMLLFTDFWFYIGVIVFLSISMNSNLHLLALKFKSFDWQSNKAKYIFLLVSVLLLFLLKIVAIPVIILLYLSFSIFQKGLKSTL
jgi:CDP-diacylglycerol--serine O-phosphatidyltransferase